MNKYPDFWSVLIGNGPSGFFFGYVVLSMLSAIGIMLVLAAQKYKKNEATPAHFSYRYFIVNNLMNIIAGLFLVPLFVRLVYEYVPPPVMIFVCIGIGFGFHRLAKIANKFGLLTTDKLSEKIATKIKQEEDKS